MSGKLLRQLFELGNRIFQNYTNWYGILGYSGKEETGYMTKLNIGGHSVF